MQQKKNWIYIIILVVLPLLMFTHLFLGEVQFDFNILKSFLFQFDQKNVNHLLILEFRLPRMVTALVTGSGLSLAGLLMQTLFQNQLAGPSILGINSGASLFTALMIITGIPILNSDFSLAGSALIGAFIFGLIILFLSFILTSKLSLLLVGVMIGGFTSAMITILQITGDAFQLKQFTLWSMGSLQQTDLHQIIYLILAFGIGLIGSFLLVKPLNALVLGEENAKMLGVNIQQVRIFVIIVTSILTGVLTAFCGPIAFVGLAVPNLVKIIFKTQNHKQLMFATVLIGALFLLLCDVLVQIIWNDIQLPINAITSLIGAPVVIAIIIKKMR